MTINHKRVERLMREAGTQGLYRRKRTFTTVRDPDAEPSPDRVNRRFTTDAPDRLWLTDSPSIPPRKGNCTVRPSWTPSPAASSAGPSPSRALLDTPGF
jgi:transposase InsO family protein